jgi:hypothetical protein
MALQLGLEALYNNRVDGAGDILSYQFIDSVFKYNLASEELSILGNELDQIMVAAENLTAIADTIKRYSVTESLVSLVGNSFPAGISQEGVSESLKKAWEKVKQWCIAIWRKIKELITYWFNGAKSLADKLGKWLATAQLGSNRVLKRPTTFKGLTLEGIGDVKNKIIKAASTKPTDATADDTISENKETKFKLGDVSIPTMDDAVAYAKACQTALNTVLTQKSSITANCDKWVNELRADTIFKISSAKGDEEKEFNEGATKENKELNDKIKKIKKATMSANIVVTRGSRALQHSAAAFLSHNPIGRNEPKAAES